MLAQELCDPRQLRQIMTTDDTLTSQSDTGKSHAGTTITNANSCSALFHILKDRCASSRGASVSSILSTMCILEK